MPDSVFDRLGSAVSSWYTLDQARIDAFAKVTDDAQFIHIDPVRAAAETPFGGTVAHGFLTLSMLSAMSYEVVPDLPGLSVNYGFDRIRFVAPVLAGQRIRGHFTVADIASTPEKTTVTWDVSVEIENGQKPALVAQWKTQYFEETQ